MTPTRALSRILVPAALIFTAVFPLEAQLGGSRTIRIAHQYPAGTAEQGDFRDQLCRRFAAEVEKRTGGKLKFEIFAENKYATPEKQMEGLMKGSLEMALVPLSFAAGRIQELNITYMPALVRSYDQAYRWKAAPVGADLTALLDRNNMRILTWVWQGGCIAAAVRPVISPDDIKGLRVRGAGKEMEQMFSIAGAVNVSMHSANMAEALKGGRLDAAVATSATAMTFKLHESTKAITTARGRSFWFILQPLLISKNIFDSFTPDQQKIVTEVAASMETFAREAVRADDEKLAQLYLAQNNMVVDMDDTAFEQWRQLAKVAAWRDFEKTVKDGGKWIEKALAVP